MRSSNRSKSYASVFIDSSKVTFLRETEDVTFCPSFSYIFFMKDVAKLNMLVINSFDFHTSVVYP